MGAVGYNDRLYLNTGTFGSPTWTEIDLRKDMSGGENVNNADHTTAKEARQGFTAYQYGLSEFTISTEMIPPTATESSTSYETVRDANRNRTTVDALWVRAGAITTDGLDAVRAICGVYGGERNAPIGGDPVTESYELRNQQNDDLAVPTYGTTSGGAFVPGS